MFCESLKFLIKSDFVYSETAVMIDAFAYKRRIRVFLTKGKEYAFISADGVVASLIIIGILVNLEDIMAIRFVLQSVENILSGFIFLISFISFQIKKNEAGLNFVDKL